MNFNPQLVASHFVDGAYIEDVSGTPIPVVYPSTGEQIAEVFEATPEIIETAFVASERAQKLWAKTAPVERGRVLRRRLILFALRNRELSDLETYDTGKALQETLYADATSAADALEYFGGIIGSVTGE